MARHPRRRFRLTRFGAGFLVVVIALLVVGTIIRAPLLLGLAAVFLLILAGGFFSTAPGAPALELNDRVREVRQWDSLGNRFPPPGDE